MLMRSSKAATMRGEIVPHLPFLDFVGEGHPATEAVRAASDSVNALLAQAVAAARRRYEMRRTVKVLAGLEEHVLQDIGVPRGEIERVAMRAVLERPGGAGGLT